MSQKSGQSHIDFFKSLALAVRIRIIRIIRIETWLQRILTQRRATSVCNQRRAKWLLFSVNIPSISFSNSSIRISLHLGLERPSKTYGEIKQMFNETFRRGNNGISRSIMECTIKCTNVGGILTLIIRKVFI